MKVVHCKKESYSHYIGRPGLLGNPFAMVTEKDRGKVIEDFEGYARRTGKVLGIIHDLPEDAILGCWCAPRACHGDVIIKLWKEMHGK
jgi:hypothetical protein